MQVIIDGRPLQTYSAFRGIGRYVENIVQAFGRDERAGFLFFRGADVPPVSASKIFSAAPRRMITLSDSLVLPGIFSRRRPDCYHSTAYGLPRRSPGTRYIMTVHDLTPMLFPQFFPLRLRSVFKRIIASARRADLVITVSRNTARDLQEFSGLPADRVQTVYNALKSPALFFDPPAPPFSLPMPFLFYCGGADRVKNLETLLPAISRLQVPLAVAGKIDAPRSAELLAAMPAADRRLVTFAGYVSDEQLAWLYGNAAAFVFPSLNEGFGYPPLEALQCGTASIVSRAGSLPEILADAAVFVDDPLDPGEWEEKIRALLGDAERQKSLVERGQKLLQRYSPGEFKKRLQRVYFPGE